MILVVVNGYELSDREQHLNVVNLPSLEKLAKEILPKDGFDFIRGGSEDEWTLRENTIAFNHTQILPHVLSNIGNPETKTSIFGLPLDTPIVMAPAAAQGVAHARGEVATAEGMAATGSLMTQSTYSSKLIAEAAEAGHGAPQFFQLYLSQDDGLNKFLLDKAAAAGIKAIVITTDLTAAGYRESDVVNDFHFPVPMANLEDFRVGSGQSDVGVGHGKDVFDNEAHQIGVADIKRVIDYTDLPVIIKGIQTPEDALLAISAGAQGIWVSNHGGRQLNGGPASIDVLQGIATAVNHQVPIIFDSGVRRGSHVFKALASGADLVALARPIIYGLALGGAQGVTDVVNHLNHELKITMQLAGTKTIADVQQTSLVK